eukprot:11232737-Alexandrium_andersonii.AAC.1
MVLWPRAAPQHVVGLSRFGSGRRQRHWLFAGGKQEWLFQARRVLHAQSEVVYLRVFLTMDDGLSVFSRTAVSALACSMQRCGVWTSRPSRAHLWVWVWVSVWVRGCTGAR